MKKHELHNAFSRRGMLKLSAASALAFSVPGMSFAAPASATSEKKAKKPGLSLQLYSVRGDCSKDFDKALEQVAAMGIQGVEFAGYHTYSGKPAELKKRLDDLGLKAAGTHIGTGNLEGDNLKKTADFHKAIGCKYLIVPGDGRFSKADESKVLAEIFNKAAEQLKPEGLMCGYHNHTHEFHKDEETGETYWDLFAERTTDNVVLQQDCGWSTVAGQDAAALIRKYPGRSGIVHFKPAVIDNEAGKKPIIGEDSVPWAGIYTACCEAGGTEWISVEQEAYLPGKTPMECTAMSIKGLQSLIAKL